MKTLKVLIISDGKAGHVTQSEGVVNYLGRYFSIEKNVFRVRPKIKVANWLLRKMLNENRMYATLFFSLFYSFDKSQLPSLEVPDLIISTGGNTCGVNALLAKKFHCKNLFSGSLRRHNPELFSGVITATPMKGVENSIVLDVVPTLINYEKLQQAGKEFLAKHEIHFDKKLWVVLIGGDGSGYRYSRNDYQEMAAAMLGLARKYGIRWLLTTSRRTGKTNENYLKTLLSDSNEIAYAVYYNDKPEKVMNAFLGLATVIFCTEDSTSMVSEAVISQKPVITLRSFTKNINKGHLAVIQRFEKQHYIHRIKVDKFIAITPDQIEHEVINVEKNYDQILDIVSENKLNQT